MNSINRLFAWIGRYLQSPLVLLLRLLFGGGFLTAGVGKILSIGFTAQGFAAAGIPYPEIMAWVVALVEILGGIMLIVGFESRIAAAILTVVMITALTTAHKAVFDILPTNPLAITQEAPFPFLVTCLIVWAFGPGYFSVDAWLAHQRAKIQSSTTHTE